jgi:hypothetical protein
MGCAGAFRDAYQQTGMNLSQSVIMFTMDISRRGWRSLRRGR